MTHLYRMHDSEPNGVFLVSSKEEAQHWNARGHGIFVSVNTFRDAVRRKDHLEKINAWAIDMDAGSKLDQRSRLHRSPLVPSYIVETKRGYQAWWFAKDAREITYNAIVLERLVPFFGADKNARDICRILRKPGYLHLKDPKEPFPISTAWRHSVTYTERQIAQAFRWVPNKATQREIHRESRPQASGSTSDAPSETLWDAIYQLDCEEGLARLSGHAAVSGERFTFKATAKGHKNIFVDGKSSPCFIDEHKRIGSPSGGGPTLVQWLRWYGHDYKYVIETLKSVFPQLADIDAKERERWLADRHNSNKTNADLADDLPAGFTVIDTPAGAAA